MEGTIAKVSVNFTSDSAAVPVPVVLSASIFCHTDLGSEHTSDSQLDIKFHGDIGALLYKSVGPPNLCI